MFEKSIAIHITQHIIQLHALTDHDHQAHI